MDARLFKQTEFDGNDAQQVKKKIDSTQSTQCIHAKND